MRRYRYSPNLLSTAPNEGPSRKSTSCDGSSTGRTTPDIGHSQRIILQSEDIADQMIRSEQYVIYTEEGYTSIESDADAVGKSLDEYRKNDAGKANRIALGNVSDNIECRKLLCTMRNAPKSKITLSVPCVFEFMPRMYLPPLIQIHPHYLGHHYVWLR